MKTFLPLVKNERGFSLVLVTLTMFLVIFLMGLCIDVGYIYVVQGELQNAADSGALAGAMELYPKNTHTSPLTFPSPDFQNAHTVAKAFVKKNKAAGEMLDVENIEIIDPGYWNLGGTPGTMQDESTPPRGVCSGAGGVCSSDADCSSSDVCLIQDLAAVLVTVKKTVPTFFAGAFGFPNFAPTATAVAARGFPKVGHPFPLAVSQCMVQHYFSQNPLPNPPTDITFWGAYSHVPGCYTGQWSSLHTGSNNAAAIKELMYSVTPPLHIGENISISVGNMESLYGYVQQDFVGKVVQLPVVQDAVLSINSSTPITGFVRFRIDKVVGTGPSAQITGHFVSYYADKESSTPGGPRWNSVTPPVLVK